LGEYLSYQKRVGNNVDWRQQKRRLSAAQDIEYQVWHSPFDFAHHSIRMKLDINHTIS